MADRDSDNEEAFHSAGEEDVAAAPPSKPKEDIPAGKEVNSAVKTTSKKSQGKKGKKKKTPALDEKGDKSEGLKDCVQTGSSRPSVDSTKEPSATSKDGTQEPKSETDDAEQRPPDSQCGGSGVESELQPGADENIDQTILQESLTADSDINELDEDKSSSDGKGQDDPPPDTEESPSKVDPSEEAGSARAESEKETLLLPEEDEPSFETGNKMIRNVQSESSAEDTSTSRQPDVATSGESAGERSISGALGRLTGEKPAETKSGGGGSGWGWGGWGASFVSSVSAVGHGLSSVIENVETSLGLPKPEELSEQEKKEQEFIVTSAEAEDKEEDGDRDEKAETQGEEEEVERGEEAGQDEEEKEQGDATPDTQPKSPAGVKGFLSLGASAITSVVGKTVTGGLDALETIGRKTMDVLQEGDHSAVKGRSRGQKGNLSEMLKDAKEDAETATLLEEEEKERQRAHFGILFDKYQGLAHLEALEMLSNQGESKVQGSLSMRSGEDLESLKTELIEIRDAFQLEELESEEQPAGSEQDFVNAITEHLFGVSLASTPDKLQKVQRSVHEWLAECKSQQEAGQKQDIKELHIKAIETLAEFSSRVIEQFHKACELMLLPQDKEHSKSPLQRATSLSKLTSVIVTEVSNQAAKFADRLNLEATNREADGAAEDINPLITNIYLEASNSTSYIQDAFQLVLPVIQMVAIERNDDVITEA